MSDRELLELAAKAAGHTLEPNWSHSDDPFCIDGEPWNPLTDDGDALRLAVRMRLNILPDSLNTPRATVEVSGNTGNEVEPFAIEELDGPDPLAATRRAIVRAAAEIGREMP